ncbi:hypothetical protein NA57DRAFT_74663 [Rhizodiscina lignyota]|uniref:SUZ domain-containing protein n=1 Tax=Rhizodiscina lignyota TaxID=1504668 RepID=A0A9P4IMB7_9PEZI|nr:hypothetical protein NA57DRAFT_74663 [Rhizodiscina lignyota]
MESKAAPLVMPARPAETTTMKPSFASVAASSYVPPNNKTNNNTLASDAKPSVSNVNVTFQNGAQNRSKGVNEESLKAGTEPSKETGSSGGPPVAHSSRQGSPLVGMSGPRQPATQPEIIQPAQELRRSIATDDGSTQVSSSDDSAKPPSMDGKSITSATTFALDEKESLRPDDSASLRAVEEEEGTSAAGSVVAGSRVGSDSGGRAFRDQLREISIMAPQRSTPNAQFQSRPVSSAGIAFGDGSVPAVVQPRALPPQPSVGASPDIPVLAPDEKLLEALESHKDRLWVLKIEQDLIDFINNTQQTRMFLPQCNSFYRMLSHRLADYYGLGHIPDQTGQAVEVFKSHVTRLAMPLSSLPLRNSSLDTPPPTLPMRKIMRRGGDKSISGTNTASNSEGPSKTTSEAGGDSASDGGLGGDSKTKAAITREEREARYREARLRIFGTAEEPEAPETPEPASEDISRSSSASERKKSSAKKQRNNNNDDGFEARSQYYYGPPVMAPGYGSDGVYYGNYQTMTSPVTPIYVNAYPQVVATDNLQNYAWPSQSYSQDTSMQAYQSSNQVNYDLSNDYQRGMQSFQNPKPMSQPATSMPSPSMAPLPLHYQPQMAQGVQTWTPPPQFDANYQATQRSQSSPTQNIQPIPYAYGQLPGPAYQNGKPLSNQHPIPGSFNRQQFNPQSQAFVPGGVGNATQYAVQQGQPVNYPTQMMVSSQGMFNPLPGRISTSQASTTYRVQEPVSRQPSNSNPATTSQKSVAITSSTNTNNSTSSALPTTTTLPTAPQQPNQHPLPQPPNPDSTIAKWGTPPHLPPKPPPPASMAPQKWMETHQRQMQMQGFASSPALSAAAQGVARLAAGAGANGLGSSAGKGLERGTGSPSNGGGGAK